MNAIPTPIQSAISNLTELGRYTMTAIGEGRVSWFDDGIVEGSGIWGECLSSEMGHNSSGVVNRLVKAGLFNSHIDSDGNWLSLTALGADVANELARKDEAETPAPVETPAPQFTTKVGRKWTYIYAADGSLVAEIRNDAAAALLK